MLRHYSYKTSEIQAIIALLHLVCVNNLVANEDQVFQTQIAPILVDKCLSCHSGTTTKGGLDLSSLKSALKGGESGPALDMAEPDASLLWLRISDDEMPPKKPLSKEEKTVINLWINSGMAWPQGTIDPFQYTTSGRAGFDWWAFKPVAQSFPVIPDGQNPIDYFINEKLKSEGLNANEEASPNDLIRRLYFDMIGLPPDLKTVNDYVSNPTRSNYESIVDQLLESPRFGERWARHWLDIVRYGESTGFERNAPNFKIWPYRDWVINAFNNDLAYDKFAQMQIAGDLLVNGPEGASASAFMVAGVHNTVIGVSQRMRLLARQDELEENAGILGQTFLGMTVQCARCHDHKFDPISNKEYYGFISAIDGVQHGERSFPNQEVATKLKNIDTDMQAIQIEISRIEEPARKTFNSLKKKPEEYSNDLPKPFAMWTFDGDSSDSINGLKGELSGDARIESGALVLDGKSGYLRTPTLKKNFGPKTFEAWVLTSNLEQRGGGIVSLESSDGSIFDALVFGEQEPRKWMAGSDGFSRTVSFQGPVEDQADQRPVHIAIVYEKDGIVTCYRDGLPYGIPIKTNPVKYPLNDVHIAIGVRHLPSGGNKHFEGRILRAAVYDRSLTAKEVNQSGSRESGFLSESDFKKLLTEKDFKKRDQLKSRFYDLQKAHSEALKNALTSIYTVTPRQNPGAMRVHLRGDVTDFGDVVPPSGLKVLETANAWKLSPESTDSERRLQLARWISSPDNAIFPRVIVNRLWHYHFGTGLVDTPNDFGFNGGRPSHPELLDYLARYLMNHNMKLKSVHRLIVNSNAYRRSSDRNAINLKKDTNNRLLWRYSPVRLEGEVLRDSMLAISGLLNQQMGGPGFIDVTVDDNNGTTYYEPLDPIDPAFQRRTIYRFSPRGGRSTLLDTFDCPDASTTSPRRNVTTTPLQALSLLHGSFAVRNAEALAKKLEDAKPERNSEKLVELAWLEVLQRKPSLSELQESETLMKKHGLWAVCLALFNTNEFVIVP